MFEDNLCERYELAVMRIKEIRQEALQLKDGYAGFFKSTAAFIIDILKLDEEIKAGTAFDYSFEALAERNEALYEDILPENYDKSYANPDFAVSECGDGYGQLLSFVYVEIRSLIVMAYEGRTAQMVAIMEFFVEIFCQFLGGEIPDYKSLKQSVYWYVSDYSDDFIEDRTAQMLDVTKDFATRIIMESDLNDLRYLYRFGEYITENEIKTAEYLNKLPEEKIKAMAYTFVEGYRKGFELTGKDISKKKIVNIRFCLGFERLVREEIKQFRELGLEPSIYRSAVTSINKKMHMRIGYYGAIPNRQMEYDHRFDNALYLDSAFVERKLGALKLAYENLKVQASLFGGPAVMEIFGENPFSPIDKESCLKLDSRQLKLMVKYDNEASSITNTYIKGEERSFTIIAYPVPEIGDDFEAIFDETVKINTLDYDVYKEVQQKIIDVLDTAEFVEVKGCNGNCTDMIVSIMKVEDCSKQTVFENCVADVNIPLGEVFTSPVLKGTNGVLNVSNVYLNDFGFKNLKVYFKDGFVTDYSCENFENEEKNKAFFKENVLFNHETLPIGEFAIGTNTTAYVMANKFDIVYKLPILIVEKMGPHFAIGDTCYSRAEDVAVYNPDGKEIISRDNEVSILRKTEPEKAYFNCHTDITIPYDEIGSITVVSYDGKRTDIIRDKRFVLEGTNLLNKPFE